MSAALGIPELWGDGVDGVPLATAEHAEPELGPVGAPCGASELVQQCPGLDHPRLVGLDAEQPQGGVVHGGAEDAAIAFNVQAPAAICGMLPGEDVVCHLDAVLWGDGRLCDVPGDDGAGHEEHGPAILAGPVAGLEL